MMNAVASNLLTNNSTWNDNNNVFQHCVTCTYSAFACLLLIQTNTYSI